MDNIISWSILVICLILTVYSAYIIKNEKTSAFEDCISMLFGGVEFNIPRWWTKVKDERDTIVFERTDTHYDWSAKFIKLSETYSKLDLQKIFEKYAVNNEIIFDQESAIIKTPSQIKSFNDLKIDALRIEGTATQNTEKRIYIDIVIFKNSSHAYLIQSKSSILNGLLEGPFFEEMILNIKKPK